jgi:hypothetical protein
MEHQRTAVLGRRAASQILVFGVVAHFHAVQVERALASAGLDGRLMVILVFVWRVIFNYAL